MGFFSGRMWFFPPSAFMICSGMIVALNGVPLLTKPLFPFYPVYGLSQPGSFVFITGLLCGYPWEHGWTAVSWKKDGLNLMKPERFLPSATTQPHVYPGLYLRSGASLFSSSNACPPWIFLTALYLPILPVSFLAKKCYHLNQEASLCRQDNYKSEHTRVSFDAHLMDCLEPWRKSAFIL